MILEPWLWVATVAAAVPIALASAVAAWRRRPDPGTRPLAVMLLAVAWWAATYLGELGAGTLAGTLFWARLEWTGSLLIPVAWLAFALEYTGREEYVTPRTVGALLVPWLASLVLVWTNPAHHLVRTPVGLTDVGGLLVLDQVYGPWFLLAAAYTYVLVAAGAGLLVAMVT
ncbi:MAG: histidine kinase N-terminal 7TM domain-containing protein, partial [Halobacteriales archaeon]